MFHVVFSQNWVDYCSTLGQLVSLLSFKSEALRVNDPTEVDRKKKGKTIKEEDGGGSQRLSNSRSFYIIPPLSKQGRRLL